MIIKILGLGKQYVVKKIIEFFFFDFNEELWCSQVVHPEKTICFERLLPRVEGKFQKK